MLKDRLGNSVTLWGWFNSVGRNKNHQTPKNLPQIWKVGSLGFAFANLVASVDNHQMRILQ